MGKLKKVFALMKEYGFATAMGLAFAKLTRGNYIQRKKAVKLVKRSLRNARQRDPKSIGEIHNSIKVSILTPVYNTDLSMLKSVIESVLDQTYQNLELCIADGSTREDVGQLCEAYVQKDSRIRYLRLKENLGISENTNAAMTLATGTYYGLLDHDDLLHPEAVEKVMEAAIKGADLIYTDEVTFQGEPWNVISTNFKPDYAPDTLCANNYICHFTVFSRALSEQVGPFRPEYDGSQDHDMILRLAAKAKHIIHIPEILYFWRAHAGSVVQDINAKNYAIEAGIRAVTDHLTNQGYQAKVRSSDIYPTIYKVDYPIPEHAKVSIVILNHNHVEDLKRCVESVFTSTYKDYEIIIVENNSTESDIFNYYDRLETDSRVLILTYNQEFNYSEFNNYAAKKASGEYLIFLNNDIKVQNPDWIQEMLMFGARADVGAVGARLFYGNDTLQHCFVVTGIGEDRIAVHAGAGLAATDYGYLDRIALSQNVTAVTGACLLVGKKEFLQVGGFDENLPVAYNDVDLCLKLRQQGYLNIYTPYATLYHYESSSRGSDWDKANRNRLVADAQIMREKWGQALTDPYYNPNFSQDRPYILR